LGLCFRCGDKFFLGHKCKLKGIYELEENDLTDFENSDFIASLPDSNTDSHSNDNALISRCSSPISAVHKTLKFQGQIGNVDMIAMLDSGSTHSFINPSLVQSLALTTTQTLPLTLLTASDNKLTTATIWLQLEFKF
jgi:Aspartyl protease